MGVYNFFSRENLSNLNPPSAGVIKEILYDIATPVFEKLNLQATENPYVWMSDFNEEGIRRIIQFSYRGTVGNFRIGTNFDFMPVINSKQNIVFKKEQCHLFDDAQTIVNSKKSISLWHKKSFIKSLQKLVHKRIHKIDTYLRNTNTISQNIIIANAQLQHPDEVYPIHEPALRYVLAFLHAKLGEKDKAIELMQEHLANRQHTPKEVLNYLEKV
ncbi:hypothetical protein C8N46_101295 [Kordia periserrulae]|uniref:Uncharacterized protein n=1 Tax=Kordia periserrulae TaxID=701523 RepID=A0A2T6C5S1_9FLAO|nr:hypothetical protein [Kordia periserrulae]PTX63691.1 hypothetical protein C8N46_101295 [Kordia periserrulae]